MRNKRQSKVPSRSQCPASIAGDARARRGHVETVDGVYRGGTCFHALPGNAAGCLESAADQRARADRVDLSFLAAGARPRAGVSIERAAHLFANAERTIALHARGVEHQFRKLITFLAVLADRRKRIQRLQPEVHASLVRGLFREGNDSIGLPLSSRLFFRDGWFRSAGTSVPALAAHPFGAAGPGICGHWREGSLIWRTVIFPNKGKASRRWMAVERGSGGSACRAYRNRAARGDLFGTPLSLLRRLDLVCRAR